MKNKYIALQRGAATLHPMMWIAAIALTALSIVGIAKLMGWVGNPATPSEVPPLAAADAPPSPVAEAPKAVPEEQPAAKEPAKAASKKKSSSKTEHAQSSGGSSANDYPASSAGNSGQRVIDDPRPVCADCGVISSIRTVEVPVEGSGVGAVAGGVVGGVVGNQFGKGSGKTAATVAGAILGGVTGHKVEEHVRSKTVYEVSLRMEDGSSRVVKMEQAPVYGEGQRVRVSGNQLLDAPRQAGAQRL